MNTYSELGSLIKAKREDIGFDQRRLSALLNVEQQTVSKWELGVSRPRLSMLAKVAEVLQLDLDKMRSVGRYEVFEPIPSADIVQLPFLSLTPEDFERLSRDLMQSLYPEAAWSRNGVSGDKQSGIDVISSNSEHPKVSCKRVSQFGPANVAKLMSELSEEDRSSEGIITLSRQATVAARAKLSDFSKWQLWDSEDLCSHIKELPQDKAVRIVDDYFPGWRERFLGIPQPTPWLTATEARSIFMRSSSYEENISMQGRNHERKLLHDELAKEERIILVSGRGGIGKTKLILETIEEENGRDAVYYDHSQLTSKDFELLPHEEPIVVLDDCISREDNLRQIVDGVYRQRPNASIIAAVREEDRERFNLELAGFCISEIKVGDLSLKEAEALARDVIGPEEDDAIAMALARIGYDCPMLIVLGGHAVRERRLDPRHPKTRHELAQTIMESHFIRKIKTFENETIVTVAKAIAALQPVRLNDGDALLSLCKLSSLAEEDILEAIDTLVYAGLVLRRNDSVRIIPDLLGEALLERALLGRTNNDTGYAQKIAQNVAGNSFRNAVKNVTIVDHQQRHYNENIDLSKYLWEAAICSVLTLPNTGRIIMIKSLEDAAWENSPLAVRFAKAIINSPADDEEELDIFGKKRTVSRKDVEIALIRLIANAGNGGELKESMQVLWSLGKEALMVNNQDSRHALRILEDLGKYGPNKSYKTTENYILEILSWFEGAREDEKVQLTRFLAVALETSAAKMEQVDERTFRRTERAVDQNKVKNLRMIVLSTAARHLNEDKQVAIESVRTIKKAVSAHSNDQTLGEEALFVIECLKNCFLDEVIDPAVRLEAYRALERPARQLKGEFSNECRRSRKALVWNLDLLLQQQINPNWLGSDDNDEGNEGGSIERLKAKAQDLANRINDAFVSETEIATWLISRLDSNREQLEKTISDMASQFGVFISTLIELRPALAKTFLTIVDIAGGSNIEQTLLFNSLVALRTNAVSEAQVYLEQAFEKENYVLVANVSTAVIESQAWMHGWVERLIALHSYEVDRVFLARLHDVYTKDPVLYEEYLLRLSASNSRKHATKIAGMLCYGYPKWSDLSNSTQKEVIKYLVEAEEIEETTVSLFEEMKEEHSIAIIQALISRVDSNKELPYNFSFVLDGNRNQLSIINMVIEAGINAAEDKQEQYGVLFNSLIEHYCESIRETILRLIQSGNRNESLFCEEVLRNLPTTFVILYPEFVNEIIKEASYVSPMAAQSLSTDFYFSSTCGIKTGTYGEAFPEDIRVRDTSQQIIENYELCTEAKKLYQRLIENAEREISKATAQRDTREW